MLLVNEYFCPPFAESSCLSGGTGRRARLKLVFRKECRFDSGLRYDQQITSYIVWGFFVLIPRTFKITYVDRIVFLRESLKHHSGFQFGQVGLLHPLIFNLSYDPNRSGSIL